MAGADQDRAMVVQGPYADETAPDDRQQCVGFRLAEGCGRLIHEDQRRFGDQRARDRDDLPLPDLTPGAICQASRAIKQERRST